MKVYISEKLKDVTARPHKKTFAGNPPVMVGETRRVFATFRRGGLPSWARDKALATFTMPGRPPEISPDRWLCYYDPAEAARENGWTAEEMALIEAKLARSAGVFLFESEKLKAPYAKYDLHRKLQGKRTVEHVVKDITAVYESAGFDIGHAIAYERQEGNHPEVIAALEALAAPTVEPEEELVAA